MALKLSLTPNTFSGITAGLSSMVADLQSFADKQIQNSNDKSAKAAVLANEASDHTTEATRARATADKIQALLS